MLEHEPSKWIIAKEALNDPWITNENTGVNLASNIHKGFDSRQTLKSLVTAVAVINKWKEIERTHKLEDEEVSETEVAVWIYYT